MFRNTLKIFLLAAACAIASPLNASAPASSSITCVTPLNNQSKQELIEKLHEIKINTPIFSIKNSFCPSNWPLKKNLITALITQHSMHHDFITRNQNPPLLEATRFNDLEFTEFLLKHNANANTQYDWYGKKNHILLDARTVAMASLLFKYGAQLDQESCETIVHNTIIHEHDPALIPLYVQHGAQINQQDNNGHTPLIRISIDTHNFTQYISPLLQCGALITPKSTGYGWNGYNAPMIIKAQLDETISQNTLYPGSCTEDIETYQQARNILKNHYETTLHMLPINKYLVESEKGYQNLEKIPAKSAVEREEIRRSQTLMTTPLDDYLFF